MKKITFIFLIFFLGVVGFIYFGNLFFSAPSVQNIKTVINSPVIENAENSTATVSPSKGNTFSPAEVAKHSAPNDCYLIINNNVYDVSFYVDSHPGGANIITSRCGMEVTGIFARIHSNRAWDLLAKYKIGNVDAGSNSVSTNVNLDINAVKSGLIKANPNAEIVNIKPSSNFYIAKVIYQGKLYEVHIDSSGRIIKEEVESDEFDWSLWDSDKDDKK